jgi:iron complex transport system substrate-binding protein
VPATIKLLWAALLLAALPAFATGAPPQRIASLNLCTDQLLLMLVPPARIASVTDWARKPESSYMAAAARSVPTNGGLVEAVLPQHPDLILAGAFTDVTLVQLLRKLGYRVEVVAIPQNLAEARQHILHFGELVGAEAGARAMVADMDARLRRLEPSAHATSERPLAAVYAPNGVTVGRGTVLAEIIERAGWRNLGSEQDVEGYGELSLERLLVAQPRLIVLDVTSESNGGGSIAHGYLEHPALAALGRSARTVVMPPRLSECVGPMTVDAIELLAARR